MTSQDDNYNLFLEKYFGKGNVVVPMMGVILSFVSFVLVLIVLGIYIFMTLLHCEESENENNKTGKSSTVKNIVLS